MNYVLRHSTSKKVSTGKYYPLGAQLKGDGANFAIYSQHAWEVFLLLFDKEDGAPTDIIKLENRTRNIWHCYVHNIKPGQLYAYKVRGEYNPAHGLRFNENKLLMDPYAKALTGKFKNRDNLLLGYDPLSPSRDYSMNTKDNSEIVPKCIVIDDSFDWQNDAAPDIPLEKLFIYEVHVKGFTAHESSKVKHPGTYLGFVEKVPYLKELGVNAVELLPVHECYIDDFLLEKGLTNYWGYNTVGFFTPESSYSSQTCPGCQVKEFKTMVRELHKAGIEVILDVVYNHTCEGNELGPTISFKGIDNPTYYLLTGGEGERERYYKNFSGCGNTVNAANSAVIRLIMDSLRYWVEVMHVDGFRFDLASVLGINEGTFKRSSSFFNAISQDPVLSRVKMIAEPWDMGSYEVGNFPIDWSEWNGKFRDTMRKFGKGDSGQLRDMGFRLTGSEDLYRDDGRSAYNSINFITCHDGFTLNDLLSYNWKKNEANLENNRDGSDNNHSWDCKEHGLTSEDDVLSLRKKMAKNYLSYLFLSCGTPMLLGGDEFLRTQKGNNNAYCQDNEISWFNWNDLKKNKDIFEYCKKLIALVKQFPILQRRRFYSGCDESGNKVPDICWFNANGSPMNRMNWTDEHKRIICYMLDMSEDKGFSGESFLYFILNADYREQFVTLPFCADSKKWYRIIDTSLENGREILEMGNEIVLKPAEFYIANPRSTVLLIQR